MKFGVSVVKGGKEEMAFELVVKGIHRKSMIPEDEISVAKTCITLGRKAEQILSKNYVEIYVDRERRRIGLISSEDEIRGFRRTFKQNQKSASIVTSFAKYIPMGRYKFYREGDFLVFNVEEITKKD